MHAQDDRERRVDLGEGLEHARVAGLGEALAAVPLRHVEAAAGRARRARGSRRRRSSAPPRSCAGRARGRSRAAAAIRPRTRSCSPRRAAATGTPAPRGSRREERLRERGAGCSVGAPSTRASVAASISPEPTRAASTADGSATIQSDARAASRRRWPACRPPRRRWRRRSRSSRPRPRRSPFSWPSDPARAATESRPRAATPEVPSATPGAGALHDLGQRRPADPLGRLGASAGARRRRHYDFAPLFKELKPYVAGADLALCHVETPMTSGAADELSDLQHPAGAGAGSQGDRLGCLRHGLEPLARPGPDRDRRHRRGARPARHRAHGLLPVGRPRSESR